MTDITPRGACGPLETFGLGENPARSGELVGGQLDRPRRQPGEGGGGACSAPRHGLVYTATLVDPRVMPVASLKRTKMRFRTGSKAMPPVRVGSTKKVAAPPAATSTVTLGANGAR